MNKEYNLPETWDIYRLQSLKYQLSLLSLQLENLSSFFVAATKCRSRNNICSETLHLWPNIYYEGPLWANHPLPFLNHFRATATE